MTLFNSTLASTMNVNGVDIYYQEQGTGPAVLLIHGLGADSSRWQHNIAALAEQHRVIAVDLPGFGQSGKPDAAYQGQFFVDMIDAFLQALDIQQVALVGNSMGGWLSMLYAQQYPQKVTHLALVAPAFYLGLPPGLTAEKVTAGAKPQSVEAMTMYLGRVLHAPPTEEEAVETLLRAHQQSNVGTAIETIAQSLQAGKDVFTEAQLQQFGHKVLLIQGKSDGIVPVAATEQLEQRLPTAALILMDEAGHWPQFEQPQRFNAIVKEYLTN